ncbi:MAG: hypothetical protein QM534_14525 [Sediminibacterium sp.]|nr:hypothetical protein [Sediminibacterium sp.]
MPVFKCFLSLLLSSLVLVLKGQCNGPFNGAANCDPNLSEIQVTGNSSIDFNFDSFQKINGGLVLNGVSVVRIKTFNNPALSCKWNLMMYISNGGGATPGNEWETLAQYGSGAAPAPLLDLIEVRVSNPCATPINNSNWQTFTASSGASLPIINDVLNYNPPGTCSGTQVNAAGSYLGNYGEYTFTIDYRITPGFVFQPGRYNLRITFCLSEM